jgi:hypothetical protein
MAGAAAKKTDPTVERRKLAQELVNIENKHKAVFARVDEIKAELRKIATDGGENFREMFTGVGVVKVSGGHDGKFKGTFPVVQEKAYFDLPDAKRKKLEDDGIIKMTPTYSGAYYGSVSVDLF